MNARLTATCTAAAIAAALLVLNGCMVAGEKVDLVDRRTENHSVELDGADQVDVFVDMGVGDCTIKSGSSVLLTAEFSYNIEEWKPKVEYSVHDGRGRLTISQPDAKGISAPNKAENTWVLKLAEDVPLSITLDLGVGEARLDVGDLRVTDLDIDHGVGELSVNLVGEGISDLNGNIDGGVGEVRVTVPSNIGVRVDADTGIGELTTLGLSKRGSYLVNDAYERSEHTIDLSVDAGVGSITIEASDSGSASM